VRKYVRVDVRWVKKVGRRRPRFVEVRRNTMKGAMDYVLRTLERKDFRGFAGISGMCWNSRTSQVVSNDAVVGYLLGFIRAQENL